MLVLILDRYQTLYQPRNDISSGKRDKISATLTHYLVFLLFPCEFRPIKPNLLIREAIIIASQIFHSNLDLIYWWFDALFFSILYFLTQSITSNKLHQSFEPVSLQSQHLDSEASLTILTTRESFDDSTPRFFLFLSTRSIEQNIKHVITESLTSLSIPSTNYQSPDSDNLWATMLTTPSLANNSVLNISLKLIFLLRF